MVIACMPLVNDSYARQLSMVDHSALAGPDSAEAISARAPAGIG
jgi:hypothetical protein